MDGTFDAALAQVVEPGPGKHLSARRALQLVGRACVAQIQTQEPRLRRSRSPEALHQIRVALRRWRTALDVFGQTTSLQKTKATLKWLARELNEARDLDVFAAAMEARRSDCTGADVLWATLERSRTEAYARADEALQSDRLRRLLWRTAHTGTRSSPRDEDGPGASEAAAAALDRRWRRLKKRGRRLGRMSSGDRHELRILAKKVRYTTEVCGDLFGHPKRQARMAKTLKRLQDSLGALNDLAVGEAIALRLSREAAAPDAAFAAGRLAGTRVCEEEAVVLKAAREAYDDFAAVDRFWAGALEA